MAEAVLTPRIEDDDGELARRIAEGDHAAFERLMRRYNRRLFRLARATLRNDADAEDALQEAYLAAYRSIAGFRGEASLGTWLSRLLLNECLGRSRRQTRRDNIVPMQRARDDRERDQVAIAKEKTPEDQAMRAELRAFLEHEVDALPEEFRLVFVLRCVEELSVEETAACLDVPAATVRSRLFRARRLLRDALTRDMALAQAELYEFGGAHCDRMVARVMRRLKDGG